MTVNQAIKAVLSSEKGSLTAKEIYDKIIKLGLYDFKSVTPVHIVLTQLRRRCEGINLKTSFQEKDYKQLIDGTYTLNK